jgi:hypothetical protein
MPPAPILPLRVEPLQYQLPVRSYRPGVLTAVGIMSIVFGAIGLLSSLINLVSTAIMAASPVMIPVPTTAPFPQSPSITASPAPLPNDGVVEMATNPQRQMVNDVFSERLPLSEPRRRMLDQLLAEAFDQIFPFSPETMTPERIGATVVDSGMLPGAAGVDGNSYFVLAGGRIEIGDNYAVFQPTQGSAIRVYARNSTFSTSSRRTTRLPTRPVTTAFRTAPIAYTPWLLPTVIAHIVLAILLLVAGILMLRSSPYARNAHRIYAYTKIPLSIATAIVGYIQLQQLTAGLTTAGMAASGFISVIGVAQVVFTLVGGAAYPIALLIVFRLRRVTDYFETLHSGGRQIISA